MFRAERVLRAGGVTVSAVPAPPREAGPCTTVLEVPSAETSRAVHIIKLNGIETVKIIAAYPGRRGVTEKLAAVAAGSAFEQALGRVLKGGPPTLSDLRLLLRASGKEAQALRRTADKVRQNTIGEVIDIRAALEFSNYCRRNCLYCGLRAENRKTKRYRMTEQEILARAREISELGVRTIILQSGEDDWYTTKRLVKIIRDIKRKTGMRITLSIGEREYGEYSIFREAGADNCLLKIETTDEHLYARLHPGMALADRIGHIRAIKKAGYITGSGNITGLPEQDLDSIAGDVMWLRQEGIHMIGTGPFIPAPGTPLEKYPAGPAELALNTIAVARLVCPNAYIPSTTALATLERKAQLEGLACGANTVMLIMTPPGLRENYIIYGNKSVVDLTWALQMAKTLKRQVPPAIENGKEAGFAQHSVK